MKNRFGALAALLILCVLTAGAGAAAATTVTPEAFDRVTPVVLAVRKAGPAVVNVSTQRTVDPYGPFRRFGRDDFFDRFFDDFLPFRRGGITRASLGSGVVIDAEKKLVLTNEHVVARASEITVSLGDEEEMPARIVGADPESDLAVLEVETDRDLPALAMGDCSDLMIGETVIAIGNPFGLSHTVSTGVISAVGRSVKTGERVYRDFIQIDASINPGNSGGPLLNVNGELIGINTAIYSGAEGIGFAIPINKARRIVKELIEHGEVLPVWLGLTLQSLDERLARYFKLPPGSGAVVTEVDPDGPAAKAGIVSGDVVRRMDRNKVRSVDDYEEILHGYTDGADIELGLLRQEGETTIKARVAAFPMEKAREIGWKRYGLRVRDADEKGAEYTVIDAVRKGSAAAEIGLRPGDLLSRINQEAITSESRFLRAMARYRLRQAIGAVVHRGRVAYRITLTP